MAGRGKLCRGYSPSIYADRVRQFIEVKPRDGWLVDAEGFIWHELTAFETCVRLAADRG